MEFLLEYGLFLAQAVTLVAAILIVAVGLLSLTVKHKPEQDGQIEIHHVNEKYKHIGETIQFAVSDEATRKADSKAKKKADKEKAKAEKKAAKNPAETAPDDARKRLYVLEFDGDVHASDTDNLREEISAVLPQIREGDEILVKLESPGGLVHGYGLAASQLQRIADAKIPLTIAVDKVAASGGYMMACVANNIIAAPFAVLGSIGVIAQLPNFNRLLKKHDIDIELLTAGEYKRTLTMLGENTDKGRQKFVEELEETHTLFKEFVGENRPMLDIAKVSTGEVWYGRKAIDVGLIDKLQTSDAFVQERLIDEDVYEVKFVHKKNWQEKMGMAAEGAMEKTLLKVWHRMQDRANF
ncbi:MAG: serine protease SohB [Halioglobus sp.]